MTRRAAAALVSILFAAPAVARDLSDLTRVYVETYAGEVAFPLTPEVDSFGSERGVEPLDVFGFDVPSLTGSSARTFTSASTAGKSSLLYFPGRPGILDVAVRGEFAALSMAADGAARIGVGMLFGIEVAPFITVAAVVEVEVTGGFATATLELSETDGVPGGSTTLVTAALPAAMANAIAAGAAVRIDLRVERLFLDPQTTEASVSVAGHTDVDLGMPLSMLGGSNLIFVSQAAELEPDVSFPSSAVEATELQLFTGRVFEPVFNIDLGASRGTPAESYGAAGAPGVWNTIGGGTTPLVDVTGAPSSANATFSGFIEAQATTSPPNAGPLLADNLEDCTTPSDWLLDVDGLPDDDFRVTLYGPSNTGAQTGAMTVNDVPVPTLLGDPGSTLIEGTSVARVVVPTFIGKVKTVGVGGGFGECRGIAGIQFERLVPPPRVPALGPAGTALLVALLLAIGGRRAAGATRGG